MYKRLIMRFIFVTFLFSQVVFRFFVVFGSHSKVNNHNATFILAISNEKKKTQKIEI